MALKRKESTIATPDQVAKWLARPMSWSQISQWKSYGKETWYEKYILDKKSPPSKEMLFGSKVGKLLETDPSYRPEVPRQKTMEYELKSPLSDFYLIGFADSYGDLRLDEYKTGKNEWTQKKVNEHGQLTMYALMLYLRENIDPSTLDINLHWLPTVDKGDDIDFESPLTVKHFSTKRTKKDVLLFAAEIIKIREDMKKYVTIHK